MKGSTKLVCKNEDMTCAAQTKDDFSLSDSLKDQ